MDAYFQINEQNFNYAEDTYQINQQDFQGSNLHYQENEYNDNEEQYCVGFIDLKVLSMETYKLIKYLLSINQDINGELTNILNENIKRFEKLINYKILECLVIPGNDIFFTARKKQGDGNCEFVIIQFIQQQPGYSQNIQFLQSLQQEQEHFIQLIDYQQVENIQALVLQNCFPIEEVIRNNSKIEQIKPILHSLKGIIILIFKQGFSISQKPLNIFINNECLYINFNTILQEDGDYQQNQINLSNQIFKYNIEYLNEILHKFQCQNRLIKNLKKISNIMMNKEESIITSLFLEIHSEIKLICKEKKFEEINEPIIVLLNNLWKKISELQKN
ncbi:hypothetical protein ABPG73_008382 [Tetrahymena malaccensis]